MAEAHKLQGSSRVTTNRPRAVPPSTTLRLPFSPRDDSQTASRTAEEALRFAELPGDRHKEAAIHSNLADHLHADGRDEESGRHLEHSAALVVEIGLKPDARVPEIWMLTER